MKYHCVLCGAPFGSASARTLHIKNAHYVAPKAPRKLDGPIGWLEWVEGVWVGLDAKGEPWVGWRP